MVEVDLNKEHQLRTKSKQIRDNRRFASLMSYDPKAAAQYAIECWIKTAIYWVPVEEFIKQDTSKPINKNKIEEIKEETTEEVIEDEIKEENDDEIEITKEDLQELLKANNIKYHYAAWIKKLTKLATDKWLL